MRWLEEEKKKKKRGMRKDVDEGNAHPTSSSYLPQASSFRVPFPSLLCLRILLLRKPTCAAAARGDGRSMCESQCDLTKYSALRDSGGGVGQKASQSVEGA